MRKIDESVFIAEGAHVIRDVVLKKNSSVWFNAVLRGDEDQIIIGEGTNIQDNCVIHCGQGYSTVVGNGVTVGHLALLHGCTIGDNTLIGMHSTVMNGAVIGSNCVIGAGSLVTGGTVIPDNSLATSRQGSKTGHTERSGPDPDRRGVLYRAGQNIYVLIILTDERGCRLRDPVRKTDEIYVLCVETLLQ